MVFHRIEGINLPRRTNRIGEHKRRIPCAGAAINNDITGFRHNPDITNFVKILSAMQARLKPKAICYVTMPLKLEVKMLEFSKHTRNRILTFRELFRVTKRFKLFLARKKIDRDFKRQMPGKPVDNQADIQKLGLFTGKAGIRLEKFLPSREKPGEEKHSGIQIEVSGTILPIKIKSFSIKII